MSGSKAYPVVTLRKGEERRLRQFHPWAYSNEIDMAGHAKTIAPGDLVVLAAADGGRLGVATYNPHSLIAARMLSSDPTATIDSGFLASRLARALALREKLFDRPFYRLIHAEADGLPGLIVDRFDDAVVLQANSACIDFGLHLGTIFQISRVVGLEANIGLALGYGFSSVAASLTTVRTFIGASYFF